MFVAQMPDRAPLLQTRTQQRRRAFWSFSKRLHHATSPVKDVSIYAFLWYFAYSMKKIVIRFPAFIVYVSLLAFSAAALAQPPGFLVGEVTVTSNPYEIAPLTAEVTFQTTVPVEVTLEVLGREPVTHTFEGLSLSHRLPVLGLYPDTRNNVILRMTTAEGDVDEDAFTVTTDPLPDFFPDIDTTVTDRSRMEEGWNLSQYSVNPSGLPVETDVQAGRNLRGLPFMFDTNGDIRYYLDLNFLGGLAYEVGRLQNGNWIFGHDRMIYEYDVLGQEINRWAIPGYLTHHEVTEKPNGNILTAVHKIGTKNKDGGGTDGDHIIEIDRASGEIVGEWDLRQVADVYRRDLVNDAFDWFHMNAIWYDETDDTLIVSGRNQGVVKITKDNELVWILAPHQGWGKAGIGADRYETADYLLTAVDAQGTPYPESVQQGTESASDFDWVWGQHAPLILPNGHLLIFDNGFSRHFTPNGPTSYSRGVEYVIDEEAMTVQQVWEYGAERGNEYFSPIISDVDYLGATGNRLIMPGIARVGDTPGAYVTEVSFPEGEVVFDAAVRFKGVFKTDKFFGEIVYRSERLPLYP